MESYNTRRRAQTRKELKDSDSRIDDQFKQMALEIEASCSLKYPNVDSTKKSATKTQPTGSQKALTSIKKTFPPTKPKVNVQSKKGMEYIEEFLTSYKGEMSLLKEVKYWDFKTKRVRTKEAQNAYKKTIVNNIGDEVTKMHLTELVRRSHGDSKAKEFEKLATYIRIRRDGRRSNAKTVALSDEDVTADVLKNQTEVPQVNSELVDAQTKLLETMETPTNNILCQNTQRNLKLIQTTPKKQIFLQSQHEVQGNSFPPQTKEDKIITEKELKDSAENVMKTIESADVKNSYTEKLDGIREEVKSRKTKSGREIRPPKKFSPSDNRPRRKSYFVNSEKYCCGRNVFKMMVMCDNNKSNKCSYGGWFHCEKPNPCVDYDVEQSEDTPWLCPGCEIEDVESKIINDIQCSPNFLESLLSDSSLLSKDIVTDDISNASDDKKSVVSVVSSEEENEKTNASDDKMSLPSVVSSEEHEEKASASDDEKSLLSVVSSEEHEQKENASDDKMSLPSVVSSEEENEKTNASDDKMSLPSVVSSEEHEEKASASDDEKSLLSVVSSEEHEQKENASDDKMSLPSVVSSEEENEKTNASDDKMSLPSVVSSEEHEEKASASDDEKSLLSVVSSEEHEQKENASDDKMSLPSVVSSEEDEEKANASDDKMSLPSVVSSEEHEEKKNASDDKMSLPSVVSSEEDEEKANASDDKMSLPSVVSSEEHEEKKNASDERESIFSVVSSKEEHEKTNASDDEKSLLSVVSIEEHEQKANASDDKLSLPSVVSSEEHEEKANASEEKNSVFSVVSSEDDGEKINTTDKNKPKLVHRLSLQKACDILDIDVPNDIIYNNEIVRGIDVPQELFNKVFDFDKHMLIPGKYQMLLDDIMTQSGLPCSFIVEYKTPYSRNSPLGYASINGNCSGKHGSCQMKFKLFLKKPDNTSNIIPCELLINGHLKVVQPQETGRPVKGEYRKVIEGQLAHQAPKLMEVKNNAVTSALRNLHRNHLQRSVGVLRNIKAQKNADARSERTNIYLDTLKRQKQLEMFPGCQTKNKLLQKGFLHNIKMNPYEASMYLPRQTKLAALNGDVNLHIDMTQGIFEKTETQEPFSLYAAVAQFQNADIENIPVFELVTSPQLNADALSSHLSQWFRECQIITKNWQPKCVVTDFSLCMLHAVSKSINKEELITYINRQNRVLHGKESWLESWQKKSTLAICQAHFCQTIVRKCRRLNLSKQKRDVAVSAIVAIMESKTKEELCKNSDLFLRLFDNKELTKEEQTVISRHFLKYSSNTEKLINISEELKLISRDTEEKEVVPTSLARERSLFYQDFVKSRKSLGASVKMENEDFKAMYAMDEEKFPTANTFYSNEVVDYFEKYLVAYLPLWCQATMPKDINGLCNAPIESYFRTVKHQFHEGKSHYAPDFYLEHYQVILGLTNTAVVDAIGKPTKKIKIENRTEEAELSQEKFKKTAEPRRKPKYIRKIFNALKGDSESKPITKADSNVLPPLNVNSRFQISQLYRFAEGEWYDDTIINAYASHIVKTLGKTNRKEHNYAVSSFFTSFTDFGDLGRIPQCVDTMFPDIPAAHRYQSVLWLPTNDVDHWYLTRIDVQNRTINTYDSLPGHISDEKCSEMFHLLIHNLGKHFPKIKESDWCIARVRNCASQLPGDCGPMTLKFMEKLIQYDADVDKISSGEMSAFRKTVAESLLSGISGQQEIWSYFKGDIDAMKIHYKPIKMKMDKEAKKKQQMIINKKLKIIETSV